MHGVGTDQDRTRSSRGWVVPPGSALTRLLVGGQPECWLRGSSQRVNVIATEDQQCRRSINLDRFPRHAPKFRGRRSRRRSGPRCPFRPGRSARPWLCRHRRSTPSRQRAACGAARGRHRHARQRGRRRGVRGARAGRWRTCAGPRAAQGRLRPPVQLPAVLRVGVKGVADVGVGQVEGVARLAEATGWSSCPARNPCMAVLECSARMKPVTLALAACPVIRVSTKGAQSPSVSTLATRRVPRLVSLWSALSRLDTSRTAIGHEPVGANPRLRRCSSSPLVTLRVTGVGPGAGAGKAFKTLASAEADSSVTPVTQSRESSPGTHVSSA